MDNNNPYQMDCHVHDSCHAYKLSKPASAATNYYIIHINYALGERPSLNINFGKENESLQRAYGCPLPLCAAQPSYL